MIKNPPIIKKVVKEMGGTIQEFSPERGCFYVKFGSKKILISRKFSISRDFTTGAEVTKFKDLTYLILKQTSLPTPKTVFFGRKNIKKLNIEKELSCLEYPIIIKNAAGSNSVGIFSNIKTLGEAKKVLYREIKNYSKLIAQEMVFGNEFRVLVLGNKVIGALELIPPRIWGDGHSTIKKLIETKQKLTHKRTPFDEFLKRTMKEQGLSLKSIPKKGTEVFIRKSSSLAEGGETKDVTDLVNQNIKKICIKASEAVKKCLVGIDVICQDISLDPKKQNFSIIEINGKPDIYIHYNPTHGKTRNVVKDIINFILKLNYK